MCNDFLPRSSRRVSSFSTDHILGVAKYSYFCYRRDILRGKDLMEIVAGVTPFS